MENNKDKEKVPIPQKLLLTVEECAEYSNIGVNNLYKLVRDASCPFVLYVGKKRLIKRKEFEKFIEEEFAID